MKFRLSVATQISLSVALITASTILVAHALGLVPDPRTAQLQARGTVAELVSRGAADAATQGDPAPVQDMIRRLVERNPDVLSIGVRRVDGSLAASTQRHEELWSVSRRSESDPGRVRIPLLRDGAPYAQVEIRFRSLAPRGLHDLIDHPLTPLLLIAPTGAFLACRLYLGRVLRRLEPAAELPERARSPLDANTEGAIPDALDGLVKRYEARGNEPEAAA